MSRTMMTRGEVWLVNFDPQIGAEIQKTRPAVVVSTDEIGKLPLRIIVPLTTRTEQLPWLVAVKATRENGLDSDTSADCFQVKSLSSDRFIRRLGRLSAGEMEEITAGIVLCIGYHPGRI